MLLLLYVALCKLRGPKRFLRIGTIFREGMSVIIHGVLGGEMCHWLLRSL